MPQVLGRNLLDLFGEAIGADHDGADGPAAPHGRVQHRPPVQGEHRELRYEPVGEEQSEPASQRGRATPCQVSLVGQPDPDPRVLGFDLVGIAVVDVEEEFSPVVDDAVLSGHPPPTGVDLRWQLRILDVDNLVGTGVEPPVL